MGFWRQVLNFLTGTGPGDEPAPPPVIQPGRPVGEVDDYRFAGNVSTSITARRGALTKEWDEVLHVMRDVDPQLSHAVWQWLRLANNGHEAEALVSVAATTPEGNETMVEQQDPDGQALIDELARRVGPQYGGGTDALMDVAFQSLLQHGAIAVELEVSEDLKDIVDVHPINPRRLEWRVVNGKWVLGRRPLMSKLFEPLSTEQVKFLALDPEVANPYGHAPFVGALQSIFFKAQMLRDLRLVIHVAGHPRLDVKVLWDTAMKNVPAQFRQPGMEAALKEWVNTQLGQVKKDYEQLEPDDAFLHWDHVDVKYVGPSTGAAVNAEQIEKVLNRQIASAVKMLPVLLGMNETATETHGCYSEDTEVLTRRGWLKHPDVTLNDEVACFDLEREVLRWQRPTRVWSYDYVGEMVRIRGRSVDMLVTPNHRMVVSCATETKAWAFRTAERIENGTPWRLPYATPFEEQPATEEVSSAYARFLGWWVSEGSLDSGGSKAPRLTQAEGVLATAMRETVTELGYDFHVRTEQWRSHERPVMQMRLRGAVDLGHWLERNCGDHSWNKHLPDGVWSWSVDRKRELLAALIEGDGTPTRHGHMYATCSPRLADDVQRLAIETGRSALVSRYDRREPWRDYYAVHIGRRRHVAVRARRHVRRQRYEGKVYCLSVPTGAYMTRRNGRMAIAGNSIQWQIQVAGVEAVQRPVKRLFEWVYGQVLSFYGLPSTARITFNAHRKVDRMVEATARQVEANTWTIMQSQGWVTNDEAAQAMTGHGAVGPSLREQELEAQVQQLVELLQQTQDLAEEVSGPAEGEVPPEEQPAEEPSVAAKVGRQPDIRDLQRVVRAFAKTHDTKQLIAELVRLYTQPRKERRDDLALDAEELDKVAVEYEKRGKDALWDLFPALRDQLKEAGYVK